MTLSLDTSARSFSWGLFERTVPRDLVHRLSVSQVLITGIRRTGARRCIAASQWPRLHVFYRNPAGMIDSALVAETLRQAAIGAAHRIAGVPLGDVMLMPGMTIHIRPEYRRSRDHATCVKVSLEFVSVDHNRTGAVASFEIAARFIADGVEFATGTTGARVVPAGTYQRMRSNSRPASARQPGEVLSREQVGQSFDCSVTIGPEDDKGGWPLRPEPGSPTLYDHGLSLAGAVAVSNLVLGSVSLLQSDPHVMLGCVLLANGWALAGIAAGVLLTRTGAVTLLVAGSTLIEPLLGQLLGRLEIWGTSGAAYLPFTAGSALISFADPDFAMVLSETAPRLPLVAGAAVFFIYIAVAFGAAFRRVLTAAH